MELVFCDFLDQALIQVQDFFERFIKKHASCSEERDIIKRAKKVIKEHLKDVSVDTMTRIQQENNQKKEAAKLKKAEKAKAAAKNTKKATNELGDEGGEGGAASSVKV